MGGDRKCSSGHGLAKERNIRAQSGLAVKLVGGQAKEWERQLILSKNLLEYSTLGV